MILKLTNLGSYFILNIFNQKNCIYIKLKQINSKCQTNNLGIKLTRLL